MLIDFLFNFFIKEKLMGCASILESNIALIDNSLNCVGVGYCIEMIWFGFSLNV